MKKHYAIKDLLFYHVRKVELQRLLFETDGVTFHDTQSRLEFTLSKTLMSEIWNKVSEKIDEKT